MTRKTAISVSVFLALPLLAQGAGVFISEIAWMGTADSTNDEWIELYNDSSAAVSLEGWFLSAEDLTPNISLSGIISAGGYFLLERTDDNTLSQVTADQIYTGALSNSGERLFLKNASGVIVDEVNALTGWPAGDNAAKETMQRSGTSWITAAATPRTANVGSVPAPSPATPPPPPAGGSPVPAPAGAPTSSPPPAPAPSISAYVGEDFIVAAGSAVDFKGAAKGLKNEPLENARFWWNFGDGETSEGRAVPHLFRVAGTYTVGLHVSSGGYAASDYLRVTVLPNQVNIAGVVEGENGAITLKNPAAEEIDIGGWVIEDGAGRKFILPVRTKLAVNSETALANAVTGLLKAPPFYPISVRYSNGLTAFQYTEEPPAIDILSLTQVSQKSSVSSVPASPPADNALPAEENESTDPTASHVGTNSNAANVYLASSAGTAPESRLIFGLAVAISIGGAAGFFFLKKYYFPQ